MPRDGNPDDDDYIAKLLAEDAKRSSIKYASTGLSALLPDTSRRPGPKPNTRFLSHLVRDVDSHNTALKKREERESRARIEEFRKKEREDERSRALDLACKRRNKHEERSRKLPERSSRHRSRSVSPTRDELRDESHSRKKRRRTHDRGEESDRRDRRADAKIRHGHDQDQGRRITHPYDERVYDKAQSTYDKQHDRGSPKQPRTSSHRPNSPLRTPSPSIPDSDPLEEIVGPLPPKTTSNNQQRKPSPIRIRGRGALHPSNRSAMDLHFSSTYNPSLDVGHLGDDSSLLDRDRSDWDMALEALRDRTSWKKKQSERLREAGFGDEEIRRWERSAVRTDSGGEVDRDVGDVRWKKRGEAREWDIGKEVEAADDDDDSADDKLHSNVNGRAKKRGDDRNEINPPTSDEPRKTSTNRKNDSAHDGWKRKDSGLLKRFTSALGP